jgi:dihydrofolate synthase/folylpolyglutamate synthase
MTYDDAIAFWYGRINYEVRSAGPKDLKLERMRALLHLIGDPHDRLRLVHVTGTKGKGSTAAMTGAILQAAGYRVGLFTSPHLVHVEERMQVNGVPISRDEFATLMELVAPAVQQLEAGPWPSPTFFEISTALGFLHFLHRRCDVAILEVGLGGRFDSTNVCHPLVSVITTVGLDHTTQLGNTLDEIAYQKAGIIKQGVPVVCGVTEAGPRRVIEDVAREVGARIIFAATCGSEGPRTKLLGRHQQANAAVAVVVIDQLRRAGMPIPPAAVTRGLTEVQWPARIEIIRRHPTVILDTAHNVPSVEALVGTLREFVPTTGRKAVVFAVSSDKQYEEMLRHLAGYFDTFHLTKYANPRGVPPERLAELLREVAPERRCLVYPTSAEAWAAAKADTGPDDLVCVTGSVFLAGELTAAVRV